MQIDYAIKEKRTWLVQRQPLKKRISEAALFDLAIVVVGLVIWIHI